MYASYGKTALFALSTNKFKSETEHDSRYRNESCVERRMFEQEIMVVFKTSKLNFLRCVVLLLPSGNETSQTANIYETTFFSCYASSDLSVEGRRGFDWKLESAKIPKTKVKGKEIPNSMLPTYQNVLDYHEFVRTSETGAQCEK